MQTPAAAWTTAAQLTQTQGRLSGQYQPIVLLDVLVVNRTFATRTYAPGGPLTVGPGVLVGGGALVGGQLPAAETLIAKLADGGLGTLSLDLNELDDSLRIGGLTASLLNQQDLAASFEPTILDNTFVRVRLGYKDLGPTEFLTLATLVLDRVPVDQERITLSMLDASIRRNRSLSVPVGGQYFPGAPLASRSKHIPILLGVNIDAPTIQVAGTAVGTLAFALSTGSTTCALTEYGAPFPDSGTVSLGAETGVTYSSRQLVTIANTTYLQLNGLVRGAPTTHAAGETVTLTSVKYHYLIGYEISLLNTVRNNGAVVSPASYTLLTQTADRRVSVLEFTTQQGTVTVDVNAANVSLTNLLTNGGFETGDLTGWTVGSGATAVVGTSNPAPYVGTYRAALTGSLGTYRDLYQEFSTVVGEDYFLAFAYQNEDSNLLTNGGFETGDLTGWTIATGSRGRVSVIAADTRLSSTTLTGLSSFLIPAADGIYLALLQSLLGDPTYDITFYQDVTTTVGQTYAFHMEHLSESIAYAGGYGGGNTAIIQYFLVSRAGYRLGTPTDPSLYAPNTFLAAAVTINNGKQTGSGYATTTTTFVATTTTTRVTIRGVSNYSGLLPPVLPIDAVRLQLATILDISEGAYQLGSPSNPTLYDTANLPATFQWLRKRLSFRATTDTARITLRSRYALNSHPTFFDDVTVNRAFTIHAGSGGENPTEAMAYIIDTFLGTPRDTATFSTAYAKLLDWRFGTVLTDPGDSKSLLQRMARQCKSLLYEDQDGQYRIVVLDEGRTVQRGFEPSNIVKDSWDRLPESLDNVYTDIYVWFGAKTGGSTTPDAFQGVTYATPTDSTHPTDISLTQQCLAAQTLYGSRHRLDVFADFVADLYTANLLLQWTVQRRTVRHDRITLRTWLDAAPLQMGDLVQVQHPSLPQGGRPVLAEVVGWHPNLARMQVGLTLRTLRPAWWSADFEYAATVVESAGWASDFEYAATGSQSSVGWEAEFEPDELLLPRHRRRQVATVPEDDENVGGARRRPKGVVV